jgi:hypothetical protein
MFGWPLALAPLAAELELIMCPGNGSQGCAEGRAQLHGDDHQYERPLHPTPTATRTTASCSFQAPAAQSRSPYPVSTTAVIRT